jgi:hypothetical protein
MPACWGLLGRPRQGELRNETVRLPELCLPLWEDRGWVQCDGVAVGPQGYSGAGGVLGLGGLSASPPLAGLIPSPLTYGVSDSSSR